jgi:hypothetical protein
MRTERNPMKMKNKLDFGFDCTWAPKSLPAGWSFGALEARARGNARYVIHECGAYTSFVEGDSRRVLPPGLWLGKVRDGLSELLREAELGEDKYNCAPPKEDILAAIGAIFGDE